MKADTYELSTILTFQRRYVIPTFQRDYEWTEGGQWALLFEDLNRPITTTHLVAGDHPDHVH